MNPTEPQQTEVQSSEAQSPPVPGLRVITRLDEDQQREFRRIKRRNWRPWTFIVKGEWDESPYHGGTTTFDASGPVACGGRHLYALKSLGIPSRISAVAECDVAVPLEVATGAMITAIAKAGGESFEGVIRWGRLIDVDLLCRSW